MGNYGIPPKIERLIRALYKNTKACVRIDKIYSDWFNVESGLRQGCNFSTMGFNIGFDHIMRGVDTSQINNGIKIDDEPNVTDLEYADDAALLAITLANLASLLNEMAAEAKKLGMKINVPKTKWMKIAKVDKESDSEELTLENEVIEKVKIFKYLGSQITDDGDHEVDIDARIVKAKTAFKKLYRGIWKRRDVSLKTKFRVYSALVEPIVLYGAESWTLSAKVKQKLDVFDNDCLRTILGITWSDKIDNEKLREISGQASLSFKAASRIIRWAGHVWRMDSKRIAARIEK